MTTTETVTGPVDHDDLASQPAPAGPGLPVERSPAELQAAARQAWLDDPTMTGAEVGDRFGRGDRWGRDRIAEARAIAEAVATEMPPGNNGNRPTAVGHDNGAPTAATDAAADATGSRSGTPAPGTAAAALDGRVVEVPPALVAVTIAAVAIVAVVTMVTSYSHTLDLAVLAGQARVAKILPAAIDGLVVAGSTSLLVDHQLRRPGSPLAWAAVVIGLVSSMAANVVAVDPTLVDLRVVKWVMAAYAPVALALSGHLLLRMLGQRH